MFVWVKNYKKGMRTIKPPNNLKYIHRFINHKNAQITRLSTGIKTAV